MIEFAKNNIIHFFNQLKKYTLNRLVLNITITRSKYFYVLT